MSFDVILKDLALRAGATGAILLDREGETVAAHAESPGLEINLIGAHHGIILDIIKDAASRQQDTGAISHVCISTESHRLAILTVKEGYYLVVTMERKNPMAKAVFESAKALARIEKEMG